MTAGWTSPTPPTPPITALGWVLVLWRGGALALVTYLGLALLLLARCIERPVCGMDRPATPFITQGVCRAACRILGLRLSSRGTPMHHLGAVVANHVSWLDIFALNASQRVYFVAKSEVAGWPMIGWLARATGTLFIQRDGRQARAQTELFEARLRAGHRLLFFPEGTSTDGLRLLPFKSTLFAAFFNHHLQDILQIQPVSLIYRAPPGADPRHYGWWGDMAFAPHLLQILATPQQGSVEVVFHAPVKVADFPDRKALAAYCEAQVRPSVEAAVA